MLIFDLACMLDAYKTFYNFWFYYLLLSLDIGVRKCEISPDNKLFLVITECVSWFQMYKLKFSKIYRTPTNFRGTYNLRMP